MTAPLNRLTRACLAQLQARFLSIRPQIEQHARIYFRGVKCPGKKADRIAETVAIAWKWFKRLAERGKDALRFVTALARYATKAVNSGRRVCGQERSKDVLSEAAQRRHRFYVGKLMDFETLCDNPLAEALIDNTRSEIPDQVAFRLDFPAWRRTHSQRDRRLIDEMAKGERTKELSQKFGISQGRISQKRREFHDGWQRFTGEPDA